MAYSKAMETFANRLKLLRDQRKLTHKSLTFDNATVESCRVIVVGGMG